MTALVIALTVMCFYCTGASWMLQFVCYPTYKLVGEKEFVPFHVSFGRRLIGAAVIPMVLVCLGTFVLLFAAPAEIPAWVPIVAAICGVVILVTTIFFEVPKHMKLDKDGKSDAVLQGLVRDNIPRTIAWTVASLVLSYGLWGVLVN
jgi:hypothetical protein